MVGINAASADATRQRTRGTVRVRGRPCTGGFTSAAEAAPHRCRVHRGAGGVRRVVGRRHHIGRGGVGRASERRRAAGAQGGRVVPRRGRADSDSGAHEDARTPTQLERHVAAG
jgi:hypothetical protein